MGRHTANFALTGVAIIGLAACSGGSSDSGAETGTLTVGLMDMPVRDVASVVVCITQVNVKPQSGPAIEFPIADANGAGAPCDGEQFDLLTLQSPSAAEMLIEGEAVPAGPYNWMELELDASMPSQGAGMGMPSDFASYVEEMGGGIHDLIMPSGSVRLVSGFVVTAGQHTQMTVDWDLQSGLLRSGVTGPPGQDGYMLRPAFRIIDSTTFGTLNGTITTDFILDAANDCNADDPDTMNFDLGNVVYLFEDGDQPDDRDNIAPNPYATITVMPNDDSTAFVYETIVAPDAYVLAFTCQGDNDEPDLDDNNGTDTDVEFHPEGGLPITITEGATTTVDFPIAM
ncbi:MAG: DUF4382 domain-containing protein [Gammaproteobacteria bacterium]